MGDLTKANKANAERGARSASEFRLALNEFGHMANSTTLIAQRCGKSPAWVRKTAKKLGVDLEALRAKEQPDDVSGDVPSPVLGFSILEFFDLLFQYFRTVEPDASDEQTAAERDPRETWIAWRVFLAAAFGLPCPAEYDDCEYPGVDDPDVPRGAASLTRGMSNYEIFKACTGRSKWPDVQAKIVSLIVGRRGGKSYITAIIGIFLACCRRYRLNLGTKGMVMILARDREQAGVIRGYILAFMKAVPSLAAMLKGEPTQKLIELTNGITIEIRAVSEAGTRGYTVVGALMDEIAFWPTDTQSAKQDKKILRALRPAMFGIKGAMIVMLSSPYAKRGELYETHRLAHGNDENARHFSWQADTLSMRPETDPELLAEIKAEYDEDPESAKAEYGAQFRSDLEAIFSKQAIEDVSIDGVYERAYVASCAPYRAFVDPSGGSSDSYVIAIAHDESREVDVNGQKETYTVPVLDKVVEWQPKFDPEVVSTEVVQLCRDFKISSVTGDAYGGEWPRDPLKKRGVNYVLSEKNRSELYLEFLPVVNSGRCELLDPKKHTRMVNQFSNLERRAGRSGKDAVDHPSGSHDDVANAVAGVMVGSAGVQYRIRRPQVGSHSRTPRTGEQVMRLR